MKRSVLPFCLIFLFVFIAVVSAVLFNIEFKEYATPIVKKVFDKVIRDHPGKLCMVIRHWPQSDRCNRHWSGNTHPYACVAAQSLEAVYQVAGNEAFWEYHKLLVDHHDQLDEAPYVKLAQQIGISEKSFLSALDDPDVLDQIKKNIESAKELDVSAVPAIFINGKYIGVAWQIPGLIEKLIRKKLTPKQ